MKTEQNDIFKFGGYKPYLKHRLAHGRRGQKLALAKAVNCQSTYISQVLHARADLSLEQAYRVNEFLAHNKDESNFFLLLVQKDRAGTNELRAHFQAQIDEAVTKRMNLVNRVGERKALSAELQAQYYSNWQYTAVHTALSVPTLQTKEALARHLALPLQKITEILEFLILAGLAKSSGSQFEYGDMNLHLSNSAADIFKHHTNWRIQAIDSLERETIKDLHYSAVYSLSDEDVAKIKELLLECIQNSVKIVRASPEQTLNAICIDFFSLKK